MELEFRRHSTTERTSLQTKPSKRDAVELTLGCRHRPMATAEEDLGAESGFASRRNDPVKSRLDLRENEKLQRRMAELTQDLTSYERKMSALREENETLMKRKAEDSRVAEDKIRTLRRKNAELTGAIRRTEEQLRQLQFDHNVLQQQQQQQSTSNKNLERGSASPLQSKTKLMEARDKNLQILNSRCQHLVDHINALNLEQCTDRSKDMTHLENALKMSALERLQLEKDLSAEKTRTDRASSVELQQQLEKKIKQLERELGSLQLQVEDKEKLEVETVQRSITIETLEKRIESYKSKLMSMEMDLAHAQEQNIQLNINNSDLQKQLEHSFKAEKEHRLLKERLERSSEELKAARERIKEVEDALDSRLEDLTSSEGSRKALEADVVKLRRQLNDREVAMETMEKLQRKKIDDLRKFGEELKEKLMSAEDERESFAEENRRLLWRLKVADGNPGRDGNVEEEDEEDEEDVPDLSDFKDVEGAEDKDKEKEEKKEEEEEVEEEDLAASKYECSKNNTHHDDDNDDFDHHHEEEEDEEGLLPHHHHHHHREPTEVDDSCEVHVFQALYDYDPQQYSPNEQPSEELHMSAGDFLVVYGGMDEDGFYFGETMEGQKGFIPSNFVRKLSENEKAEFYKIIHMDLLDPQLNNSRVLLPPLTQKQESLPPINNGQTNDKILQKPWASQQTNGTIAPDPPVSINVEFRPRDRSLVASWLPVTIALRGTSNGVRVAGYCVYVDGRKVKVANDPTDDQVEMCLDDVGGLAMLPRYVTVRTLASDGTESADSAPFFLSYSSTMPTVLPDARRTGRNVPNVAVEDVQAQERHLHHLLAGDEEFDSPERPWKNLPNRQSLDFQATQQFQALHRSASVNDAHPIGLEGHKFSSDSGLLGGGGGVEEKCLDPFEQGTKSLDSNSHDGTLGVPLQDATRHPNLHRPEADRPLTLVPPGRLGLTRRPGGYGGVVLTSNDVVTPVRIREDIPDVELIDYEDEATESPAEEEEEEGVEADDILRREEVRIFIALFNYNPVTMSPNPDAADVELKFEEGQIIKIFGSKDEDGFFLGEAGGKRGLVPCNMVSEVEVDDPNVAEQLLMESSGQVVVRETPGMHGDGMSSPIHVGRRSGLETDGDEASQSDQRVRHMRAMYNYNPQELSPNADVEHELSFRVGEVVEVFGNVDDDGFYYGRIGDRIGLVPSNFVMEILNDTLL